MRTRLVLPALGALAIAGCVAACAGGADGGPVFDNQGGDALTCMAHQPADPGTRYTDPALRATGEVLAMMRYYTANTGKPFCDGKVATDTDRRWAQEYVDLGGAREKVAGLLG